MSKNEQLFMRSHGYLPEFQKYHQSLDVSGSHIYSSLTDPERIAIKVTPVHQKTFEITDKIMDLTLMSSYLGTIYGHYMDPQHTNVYIVMNKLTGCDLFDLLVQKLHGTEPLITFNNQKVIQQVARGLQHLHEGGVIHMDIKPENIRILEDGSAVLYDYNLSQTISAYPKRLGGTLDYLAPELYDMLMRKDFMGNFDEKVDIWSLGIVIFYLIEYAHPYDKSKNEKEFYKMYQDWIGQGETSHSVSLLNILLSTFVNEPINDLPERWTNKWQQLFYGCMGFLPKDRITAKQIADTLDNKMQRFTRTVGGIVKTCI